METNNYLTNESNLNTTYLSSLQLAIAKGHTDLQLWLDRNGVSLGTTPIRTWLRPTNERKQKKGISKIWAPIHDLEFKVFGCVYPATWMLPPLPLQTYYSHLYLMDLSQQKAHVFSLKFTP